MIREIEALCVMKKGRLDLQNPAFFVARVAQMFGDGEEVIMTVHEAGIDHTGAQRRYFHGPVLDAYVKHGWNRAAAKAHLCLTYIPEEFTLPDGSIIIAPGHTTPLSKKRYNELIDSAIEEAARELGEIVLDSEEWRASQRKKGRAA